MLITRFENLNKERIIWRFADCTTIILKVHYPFKKLAHAHKYGHGNFKPRARLTCRASNMKSSLPGKQHEI